MGKSKKTIAIFGSCVSRDNFNTRFNANYKKDFEVVLLENQTTILSLMANNIKYNDNSLDPLTDWDRKMTLTELNKSFLLSLKSLQPDILIIDFFADSRFQTIEYKNSFFTVNDWKNTKTNIYKEMEQESTPFIPTEIQLEENMKKLYDFCKRELPTTIIILNKARAVNSYQDMNGKTLFFNKEFINKINNRWELLDNLWLTLFPDTISIDAMTLDLKGDINHPWGNGYVHYTKQFYHNFIFGLKLSLSIEHLKTIKKLLAGLNIDNVFPKEKNLQIKEIFFRYSFLALDEKKTLDNWLNSRYKKVLEYILKYEKSAQSRIDFAYNIFRWGQKGAIAQDIDFSLYLIEPIINNQIETTKDSLDYAFFAYGTIMFHKYRDSINNNNESIVYYQKALDSLFRSSKAKSLYLQQRSFYFLFQTYNIKNDFNKSLVFYIKAISYENTPLNQYPLIFSILVEDLDINLNGIFKDVNQIFSKENIQSHFFWKLLLKHITIESIQKKIKYIIEFNLLENHNKIAKKIEDSVITFAKLLSNYYLCTSIKDKKCDISCTQSLYNNTSLTNRGRAEVLFRMAEQTRDIRSDLNRAVLMFSESIDLYMNKSIFISISDIFLKNFSYEIREVLKDTTFSFRSVSVNQYIYEKEMGKSAWKRFVNVGFVSGYFEEEIEFLEYILEKTKNKKLKKLTSTRLAFLYYKGHAGIRIHDYNQPDYHRAEKLFKTLTDNPLVTKYLNHPVLSIYNKLETINKDEHYLYFENKESNKLIIVFACAFGYAHYSQLYTFYQKNKTNVLFLNNPKLNWYHGTEWDRVTRTIEQIVNKNFDKKNVISYFGSMGGYMALKVGLTYGFKTIIFNPQIDMNIWLKHRPVLAPRLREQKALIHIQDFKTEAFESTPIYYMTSSSIEDVEVFSIFIDKISLCKNGLFIIEKIPDNSHAGIFGKVYKEHQQDVILNIAQLQDRYFYENNDTIEYQIAKELHKNFWSIVINCMEIRLIIQIVNQELYVAKIKENLSKKIEFSKVDLLKSV